jgi:hypothetical protein
MTVAFTSPPGHFDPSAQALRREVPDGDGHQLPRWVRGGADDDARLPSAKAT